MDYDASKEDAARQRLIEALGSRTMATVVIDGEVIIGFQANRERVAALLGVHN